MEWHVSQWLGGTGYDRVTSGTDPDALLRGALATAWEGDEGESADFIITGDDGAVWVAAHVTWRNGVEGVIELQAPGRFTRCVHVRYVVDSATQGYVRTDITPHVGRVPDSLALPWLDSVAGHVSIDATAA